MGRDDGSDDMDDWLASIVPGLEIQSEAVTIYMPPPTELYMHRYMTVSMRCIPGPKQTVTT